MTLLTENALRFTGPLWGEPPMSPNKRPIMPSFHVYFVVGEKREAEQTLERSMTWDAMTLMRRKWVN